MLFVLTLSVFCSHLWLKGISLRRILSVLYSSILPCYALKCHLNLRVNMSYALDEGQRWYKGSRVYQYSCTHLYVSGVFVENKIKKVSMQDKEGEYAGKI